MTESQIAEYEEILNRLDRLDEKAEFVSSEVAQRMGKKLGREVGILYGITAGLFLILVYLLIG
ncbi:tetrahydromethanopterin S-methyltransferase subunit MtrG [Methanolapillus ohkumae]